ncbi:hypothetical protein [Campylobacter ureolyticus]|uniref:Uncharacterized protein n=1 Tax=Campylobacter ureolyticus TaxID=827 RepID=A0A381EB39_9BACT|nr:hypothetical protein [Campylobacter ureolyticus]MCR8684662.1 hypothetical protein [Campylobacter ureolyticus]MCZ6111692.1 hypothetical protein [Campylobacter ureolyticus]MCZ6159985.1 hypothetical protein [Campylobacter ureolyticus]MCZ6163816.1 hypothetical protein [Campylobacter ureolyticus]MCZ6165568.1 hypothetical protein [Campylobacter ureolyticus]
MAQSNNGSSKIFEIIILVGLIITAIISAWAVLTPNSLFIG